MKDVDVHGGTLFQTALLSRALQNDVIALKVDVLPGSQKSTDFFEFIHFAGYLLHNTG